MEKKQTAVTELIEKMNEAKDNFPALGFDEEFVRGFNKAFQMACFIAEKVGKPKEREQIEEAFKDGITGDSKCVTSTDYYTQTFKP